MSVRSFAEYSFKQKMRAGFCGDTYRAVTPEGNEVRITVVAPDLLQNREFVAALTKYGGGLASFEHPNIVVTRAVGKASDGQLVIASDAVPGRVDVAELLASAGGASLPQDMAAAIGYHLLAGLAAAHRSGLVHGAIHPGCVVIDVDGQVKLADLATGRALAIAGAGDPSSRLLRDVGGYLPPELRRTRQVPSKTSDVYAAAAVIFHMLSGSLPPGTLDISPGFERMIQRALDADLSRRYSDGGELFDNFAEALEDDNWLRATPSELATYCMEAQSRGRGDLSQPEGARSLDEATEDLLSILGHDEGQLPSLPETLDRSARPSLRSFDFSSHSDGFDDESQEASAEDSMELPNLALDAFEGELDPPTQVDTKTPAPTRKDPISELISLTGAKAPPRPFAPPELVATPDLPLIAPDPASVDAALSSLDTFEGETGERFESGDSFLDSLSKDLEQQLASAPGPRSSAREFDSGEVHTLPGERPTSQPPTLARSEPPARRAPVPVAKEVENDAEYVGAEDEDAEAVARARPAARRKASPPARAVPRGDLDVPLIDPADLMVKKSNWLRNLVWLALVGAAVGFFVWVYRGQIKLREESTRRQDEIAAQNEAAIAAHNAAQPKEGRISVTSEPDGAAVWLKIGRTPASSRTLPTSMAHELRLELDGYKVKDMRVVAMHWSGEADNRTASVSVELEPGEDTKPVPAYPPEPPPSALEGLTEGKGNIQIASTPPGAAVWLLIGITPDVEYVSEADARYELKVVRDGYLPGFLEITPEEWKQSSDPQHVTRSIKLVPRKHGSDGKQRDK